MFASVRRHLSYKKSNGVPVSRPVWRLIKTGDAARARRDWRGAQAAYEASLQLMPGLAHIWVQLGHAAKEAGDLVTAQRSYTRAAELSPDDPEPFLRLGHMLKRSGTGGAGIPFLQALRRSPQDLAAAHEVMQHLLAGELRDPGLLTEALTLLQVDPGAIEGATERTLASGTMFFDVTDVLSFFSHSRFPSGVQRVQIATMLALIEAPDAPPFALCQYSSARRGWALIDRRPFAALCASSMSPDGGGDWAADLRLLYVASALAPDLVFPPGSFLISFGASAPDGNYLLRVRTACARDGLVYVPVVYDLIPVLFPHWVTASHAQEFISYARSLVHSARGFIAISDATRRDLLSFAAGEGAMLAGDMVAVTRLDGDFPKAVSSDTLPDGLAQHRLDPDGYVLFVSTIEPRKNHLGAFRAWQRLGSELRWSEVPPLVCVGGKGWLNDDIHAELAADADLRRKVIILSNVSDDGLGWLYQHCAFTLYPSFYEGWGLPVTESLSYGKLPVVSSSSSMPEAGGSFAVYVDPHDVSSIAEAIRLLLVDRATLAAAQQHIARDFRPRSWRDIALELVNHARAIGIASMDRLWPAPELVEGRTVSLASAADDQGSGYGEPWRLGLGWGEPGPDGCEVIGSDALLRLPATPSGAVLRLDIKAGDGPVRMIVEHAGTDVEASLASGAARSARIALLNRDEAGTVAIRRLGDGRIWVSALTLERSPSDEALA